MGAQHRNAVDPTNECAACGDETLANRRYLVTREEDGAYDYACPRPECLAAVVFRLTSDGYSFQIYTGRELR